MAHFDVINSQDATADTINALGTQLAYRQGLHGDRSNPVQYLSAVALAQLAIDQIASQAQAATHLADSRKDALANLRAANRGYAATLCMAFEPPPQLSDVLTQAALGHEPLGKWLATLGRAPLHPQLIDAVELTRETAVRALEQVQIK
jgi:hypothetical protein